MADPKGQEMRFHINWSETIGGIACLAVAFGFPQVNPATASAATGAPNVGNFVSGTYSCSTQSGPTAAVRMNGKWAGREDAYFIIATPWGWKPLDASSMQIRVNNNLVNDQSDQARANVARIPAWDGVPGHEPTLRVTVSNPPGAQPFHFLMQWTKGTALGLLSIGEARWDGTCSDTTNPPPR